MILAKFLQVTKTALSLHDMDSIRPLKVLVLSGTKTLAVEPLRSKSYDVGLPWIGLGYSAHPADACSVGDPVNLEAKFVSHPISEHLLHCFRALYLAERILLSFLP